MKVRDDLNSIDGYNEFISTNNEIADEILDAISQTKEAEKNHIQLYNSISNSKYLSEESSDYLEKILYILIAQYSKGEDMSCIRSYIQNLIDAFIQNQKHKGSLMYDQLVWILSIIIMLEIENDKIEHIFKLINPSNDYLISFLIRSQIPSWKMPSHEQFYFELPYQSTKEIISLVELGQKDEAVIRLKKYLTKEWYRGNAEMGWHNDHKSKFNLHFGYWSFESGALVKILGLDDSSLKGLQYYPYDMVHWNN